MAKLRKVSGKLSKNLPPKANKIAKDWIELEMLKINV